MDKLTTLHSWLLLVQPGRQRGSQAPTPFVVVSMQRCVRDAFHTEGFQFSLELHGNSS